MQTEVDPEFFPGTDAKDPKGIQGESNIAKLVVKHKKVVGNGK